MRHVLTLEVDGVVVNVEEPLGDDADGEQILIQNLVDELLQLGLSLENEVPVYNEECCNKKMLSECQCYPCCPSSSSWAG